MRQKSGQIIEINDLQFEKYYWSIFREQGLVTIEAFFRENLGRSLRKPGLGEGRERIQFSLKDEKGRERTFFLKRFRHSLKWYRGKGLGRIRSPAGREWFWLWNFRENHLPCPCPVAFGEEIRGKEVRSFVVMEAVPGISLEQWIESGQWEAEKEGLPFLIDTIAELGGRMHRLGYIHRDFYLSHLFYDKAEGEGVPIHIIDLQRVLRMKYVRTRWIVKDLASLHYSTPMEVVSPAKRIRFFLRYMGKTTLEKKDKRLIGKIIKKANRIKRHEEKRQGRFRSMNEKTN